MEMVSKMTNTDPVQGLWCVNNYKAKVWVDSSWVALGVAMEIDGAIVVTKTPVISIWQN